MPLTKYILNYFLIDLYPPFHSKWIIFSIISNELTLIQPEVNSGSPILYLFQSVEKKIIICNCFLLFGCSLINKHGKTEIFHVVETANVISTDQRHFMFFSNVTSTVAPTRMTVFIVHKKVFVENGQSFNC